MGDRVEALLLVSWDDLPDPDDARPLEAQVNEILDGVLALVCDSTNADWAEVLSVHSCAASAVTSHVIDLDSPDVAPGSPTPGSDGG